MSKHNAFGLDGDFVVVNVLEVHRLQWKFER